MDHFLAAYDFTVGNTEILDFGESIRSNQIWFKHIGNDFGLSKIFFTAVFLSIFSNNSALG